MGVWRAVGGGESPAGPAEHGGLEGYWADLGFQLKLEIINPPGQSKGLKRFQFNWSGF